MLRIQKIKVIAFDMDGTLFNSFSVSYDAVREGFEKFWADMGEEGPVPLWADIKQVIGLPSYQFYPAILPAHYHHQWHHLHKYIAEAEKRRLESGQGRCFDGVHETLAELKRRGYMLGCLSNASRRYFDSVMDECSLRQYFGLLSYLGEDRFTNKADILEKWANDYGGKNSVIYLGDREGDIESAHAAGVQVIGVTWGYGSPGELKNADALIDRMKDLLELVP